MEWKSHYSLLRHQRDMSESFPSSCSLSLSLFFYLKSFEQADSHVNVGAKICQDKN